MKILFFLLLLLTAAGGFAQDGYNDLRNFEKRRNKTVSTEFKSEKTSISTYTETVTVINTNDLQTYLLKRDSLALGQRIQEFGASIDSLSRLSDEFKKNYAIHKIKRVDGSRELIITLDSIASHISYYADTLSTKVNNIKSDIEQTKNNIAKMKSTIKQVDYEQLDGKIKANFTSLEKKNKQVEEALETLQKAEKAYKNASSVEAQKKTTVSALPQITDMLGTSGAIIPTISLLGNQYFSKGTFKGEIRVFTANASKNTIYNWKSLTLTEQSNFGVVVDVFKGFWLKKSDNKLSNLGLKFGFAYLMKPSFKIDSSGTSKTAFKDFNFGTLQFSLGAEYVAFPNILTLHADYTGFTAITNLKDMQQYMAVLYDNRNKPSMGFYNAGARFRINPEGFGVKELDSSYLTLDLNFTFVNNFLTKIASGSNPINPDPAIDKMIPTIRVSLKI